MAGVACAACDEPVEEVETGEPDEFEEPEIREPEEFAPEEPDETEPEPDETEPGKSDEVEPEPDEVEPASGEMEPETETDADLHYSQHHDAAHHGFQCWPFQVTSLDQE